MHKTADYDVVNKFAIYSELSFVGFTFFMKDL